MRDSVGLIYISGTRVAKEGGCSCRDRAEVAVIRYEDQLERELQRAGWVIVLEGLGKKRVDDIAEIYV